MVVLRTANRISETVRAVNWHHQMLCFPMDMVHRRVPWVASRRGQRAVLLAGHNEVPQRISRVQVPVKVEPLLACPRHPLRKARTLPQGVLAAAVAVLRVRLLAVCQCQLEFRSEQMRRHLRWQTGRLGSRPVPVGHLLGLGEVTGPVLRHRSDIFPSPGQFKLSVPLMSYVCLMIAADVLSIEFRSWAQQINPSILLLVRFVGGLTVGVSQETASTGSLS